MALVCSDAVALPFVNECFDVVTQHSFLYLVSDRHAVIREVYRVLRPGGKWVMLEPNEGGCLRSVPFMEGELRFRFSMIAWLLWSRGFGRFGETELADLLELRGFEDVLVQETLSGLGLLASATKVGSAGKAVV